MTESRMSVEGLVPFRAMATAELKKDKKMTISGAGMVRNQELPIELKESAYREVLKIKAQQDQIKSTTLSTLIWEGRWEQALERLSCVSTRREAIEEIHLPCFQSGTCQGLALHLACAMRPLPPTTLIEQLIQAFPAAVTLPMKQWGLLPLHLICDMRYIRRFGKSTGSSSGDDMPRLASLSSESSDSEQQLELEGSKPLLKGASEDSNSTSHDEIVALLLKCYPDGLHVQDSFNGMLPIHIAASTTQSENGIVSETLVVMLELLLKAAPTTKKVLDNNGNSPVDLAWGQSRFECYHCNHKGNFPCKCPHLQSVPMKSFHPLLREQICKLMASSSKKQKGKSCKAAR